MSITVSGHKSPDTDTICSAIAYAWLLNQKGEKAKAVRLGDLNKETECVLEKFNIEDPELIEKYNEKDELVIVDTNNPDELLPLERVSVRCIIDHHKLTGGIKTDSPIPIVIKPWASTATIIWKHIKHSGVEVDNDIAGILMAAILSDTLKFTSPTTTQKDKDSVTELSKICGVDADSLAKEMFDAKSDLEGMTARDILTVDSKVFEMAGKKIRVSVLETTNPGNALEMIDDLLEEKEKLKKEESLDMVFFFAVDILKSEAILLGGDEEENSVAESSFDAKFDGNKALLPGIVSRKKQIIPKLQPTIESL